MDATPPKKFMFDLSFDDASIVHRAAERKPVLMKPDQVDAMKKESYDLGFEAGKVAGHNAQTEQVAAVLVSVDQSIGALMQNFASLTQQQETQTRQLVMAIAKKILPEFVARNGVQEIEPLIAESIREMAREPRLVVRVHEQQFDAINEKAQAIATERAYVGKVIVLADPGIALGDCRVEWADGGLERNTQSTWAAIEQTVSEQTINPPV